MYAMKKLGVQSVVVGILLAIAVIVEAQQPKKVPRIGFLRKSNLNRIFIDLSGVG